MEPHYTPILLPDTVMCLADGAVEITLGDHIFEVSGYKPSSLHHALSLMNGLLDVPAIAALSQVPKLVVSQVVKELHAVGALSIPSRSLPEYFEPQQFALLCRKRFAVWKRHLFSHPLWIGLSDGTLSHEVFVGWVLETWFFIDGVLDRLPMAIAHTEHRGMRQVFMKHFAEEWDHAHFFTRALDRLGISAADRAVTRSLPSTRAIQDWLRNAARRDPLRYAVCSGFLESTGNDRAVAREFFRNITSHYDCNGNHAVQPLADHVSLDEDYGHGHSLDNALIALGSIQRTRASAALQSAYGLVETLEMWSTDILTHYGVPGAKPLDECNAYRRRIP